MIYDLIENFQQYTKSLPELKAAIDFIQNFDQSQPDGKYEIDGTRCFAIVSSYNTKPSSEIPFEGHHKYIDVQMLLSGEEKLEFIPLKYVTKTTVEYNPETDLVFYDVENHASQVILKTGEFITFYPSDLHKPYCNIVADTPVAVRKVVVKIAVD